jgi:hypothetical protein
MMFLDKIAKSIKENKFVFFGLVVLVAVNLSLSFNTKKKDIEAPLQADTVIPKGHVLLPISLSNIESIKGLIDQFGVIDLYVAATSETASRKIARRIKILKAPLNENEFAVLVSEQLAEKIMNSNGIFTGVIQNRYVPTSENLIPTLKKKYPINVDYNPEENL